MFKLQSNYVYFTINEHGFCNNVKSYDLASVGVELHQQKKNGNIFSKVLSEKKICFQDVNAHVVC